ncbi:MAG: mercury transporter MerT [Methylobacterium sp.]|uniref:mercuric transporter MerT family protein n=1 Tax=Methylobacterium sp. TaxID=409 RepID=UPI0025D41C81|nr:mercuric transporter MerT family protein [Methylobacterium sp.]MBX9933464.1 mercury transporter MerT [Methylobacterium sp.]
MMTDTPSAVALPVTIAPSMDRLPTPTGSWFAGLGTLTGLGALVASSCCALPVALTSLGATGAVFGGLAMLSNIRPLLLGGAALALVIGWGLFLHRRATECDMASTCARTGSSWPKAALLGVGTALVDLALMWETYLEPIVLRAMR